MNNTETALMEHTIIREHRVSPDESQLVLAAQKGDLGVFNELVLLHQDAVFNLAYRILGDADAAEDITQNAFLIAYRKLSLFRNGSFRSWLFRITTNACIDELRRRKRHPMVPIETDDKTEENLLPSFDWPVHQSSPEQCYAQRELEQSVQSALNLLGPDQRAIVVLVDMQDLSYEEAAQVLRLPIGTVKSRLARGREHLRRILLHREM
jgi:RNA polymerase sigma-70 factor (ECF subfamily)